MTPSTTPDREYLTPAQQRAVALLSAGCTATAAAEFVGVHRNTIGNWLRSAYFRDTFNQIRDRQDRVWRDQTLRINPPAPAAARPKAALAIECPHAKSPSLAAAKMAAAQPAAQPGRNQPCPCGSGRKFKRCCISIR